MILSGWETAVLLSNTDGELITTLKLPSQPVVAPKVVDFDGDGLNDIIFTFRQA